ncbi:hypothetical protein ACFFIF_10620 [Vagococcus entomophilus]|uniref:Uncharacterized protein n=1 Tax=Vagococcus entomophilus TaxID=1160095 RepID=A0A430AEY4_9ENTE|nr:hypothetical protein [Vagococcus entomophilus]RSU06147.1 hypothetical protein CBF30_10530 [Vagococcus entomophilus]
MNNKSSLSKQPQFLGNRIQEFYTTILKENMKIFVLKNFITDLDLAIKKEAKNFIFFKYEKKIAELPEFRLTNEQVEQAWKYADQYLMRILTEKCNGRYTDIDSVQKQLNIAQKNSFQLQKQEFVKVIQSQRLHKSIKPHTLNSLLQLCEKEVTIRNAHSFVAIKEIKNMEQFYFFDQKGVHFPEKNLSELLDPEDKKINLINSKKVMNDSILVYGLAKNRDMFLNHKDRVEMFLDMGDKNEAFVIDQYNMALLNGLSGKEDIEILLAENKKNFFNIVKKTPVKKFKNKLPAESQHWNLWKGYLNILEKKPKFNPANLANEIKAKYSSTQLKRPKPHLAEELTDSMIKKGCKAGLELAKEKTDLKIWFVLDGMDLNAVAFKTGKFKESFTGSELRYIYRNRYLLENKVVFFKDQKVVTAPWKEQPDLWKQYECSRKKNLNLLKDNARQSQQQGRKQNTLEVDLCK